MFAGKFMGTYRKKFTGKIVISTRALVSENVRFPGDSLTRFIFHIYFFDFFFLSPKTIIYYSSRSFGRLFSFRNENVGSNQNAYQTFKLYSRVSAWIYAVLKPLLSHPTRFNEDNKFSKNEFASSTT